MKPIRDYSDGQWLLLLWAFIVLFLLVGIALSTPVLVVAILGAIGAGYTTYLYARERIGRSPTGSLFEWPTESPFGRPTASRFRRPTVSRFGRRPGHPADPGPADPPVPDPNAEPAPRATENHEGGAQ